jgi:hypothetical protein
MSELYKKIAPKITPDMDNTIIEIACKCYNQCNCFGQCLCKKTTYDTIKKYIRNTQKQADTLHIITCMHNMDSPVMSRLSNIVELLRNEIRESA